MADQHYKRTAAVLVGKSYLRQYNVPLYTDCRQTFDEKKMVLKDKNGNRITQNGEITATILRLRLEGKPIDQTLIRGAYWNKMYYWPTQVSVCLCVYLMCMGFLD